MLKSCFRESGIPVSRHRFTGAWLAIVLSGCSENGGTSPDAGDRAIDAPPPLPAQLSLEPAVAALGDVLLGDNASVTFTLRNAGGASGPIELSLSEAASYSIDGGSCVGARLEAASICTIAVRFQPAAPAGPKPAVLTASAGPGIAAISPLSGRATAQVLVTNTGGGTIVSVPAGIRCGEACSATFSTPMVTLTASPDDGNVFRGWSAPCGDAVACVLSLDGPYKAVVADFALQRHSLAIALSGAGDGIVTSSPAGIECGASCSAAFDHGTRITLSASPGPSSTFTGWGGACSGSEFHRRPD